MAGVQQTGVSKPARIGGTEGGSLLTVISATTLIGIQALATALAAAWALAGLTTLGNIGEYALMALFGAAALYATYAYLRRAYRVELGSQN